jgi:hypothetical protein
LAIDDTGLPKQGTAAVGVQRQYCGALGKIANCQIAVSTALIAGKLAWLTSMEVYLPQIWMDDDHRARARIPRQLPFREKWRMAVAHIRTVLAAGFTLEAVVADAAYGEIAKFRAALERLGVAYVVAVPYVVGARLTGTVVRDSLAAIANGLAPSTWHRIGWGHGTKGPLEARFAAVRVTIPKSRSERWLLCQESLVDGERQYYFSNLPADIPLRELVRVARSRSRPVKPRKYRHSSDRRPHSRLLRCSVVYPFPPYSPFPISGDLGSAAAARHDRGCSAREGCDPPTNRRDHVRGARRHTRWRACGPPGSAAAPSRPAGR